MLTSQCKNLHDLANDLREHYTFVGFGGMANRDPTIFSAARQMDDAADTIERLREELHDLLYVQAHWELDHCPNCEARLDLMVLRDENAKLRELARDLWVRLLGTDDNCGCGDCRVCNHDAFNYENHKCVYNQRMRAMGIEVEE